MGLDNTITISGNLTREPELRFTPSGQAVANLSVAVNRRWTNRTTGDVEEAVSFIDVTAWGDLGEHCADSLPKGARVVVTGRLDQQTWQNDEGENRHKHVITADDIAPSLKWAKAKVMRLTRDHGPGEPAPAPATDGDRPTGGREPVGVGAGPAAGGTTGPPRERAPYRPDEEPF